jgi:hypothetical protein
MRALKRNGLRASFLKCRILKAFWIFYGIGERRFRNIIGGLTNKINMKP